MLGNSTDTDDLLDLIAQQEELLAKLEAKMAADEHEQVKLEEEVLYRRLGREGRIFESRGNPTAREASRLSFGNSADILSRCKCRLQLVGNMGKPSEPPCVATVHRRNSSATNALGHQPEFLSPTVSSLDSSSFLDLNDSQISSALSFAADDMS